MTTAGTERLEPSDAGDVDDERPTRSEEPHRARVLAAVADAALRARMVQVLSTQYVVDAVANGKKALEHVRAATPDIVVSDADLPELDGFGLLNDLRNDAATQAIPLILLSARTSGEFAIDGLEAVADDYLEKPFPMNELLARVRTHLEFARSRRAWALEIARSQGELARLRNAQEVFHNAVARELRVPLRAVDGFSGALIDRYAGKLDSRSNFHLERIHACARRMGAMIDDLVELSRVTDATMHFEQVRLSEIARRTFDQLRQKEPLRDVTFDAEPDLVVHADKPLAASLLRILVTNAWKFTSMKPRAKIVFGMGFDAGRYAYFVRDDGAGFDQAYADKLFSPFQRMHRDDEFEGNGIGLAVAKQAALRHGGDVWAVGAVDVGATFYFTLGAPPGGERA